MPEQSTYGDIAKFAGASLFIQIARHAVVNLQAITARGSENFV
jgi:hypothetical protein